MTGLAQKNITLALEKVEKNYGLSSVDAEIRANEQQTALLMCDLKDLHEDLNSSNINWRVKEMGKINKKLKVLAESRTYLEAYKSVAAKA